MTLDSVKMQDTKATEKPPVTVQNDLNKELQKEVATEATQTSNPQQQQKQGAAVAAQAQPLQQLNQTAQNQISKGFLDVKV